MKAICITNRNHDTPEKNCRNAILTIGKIYDIKSHYFLTNEYSVVSDVGHNIVVPYYYFKFIDEYRENQIEEILK
jgi:hypothetical protein